ncbi:MAG: choline/carnitine O-acyltransferase [Calditrichaeota bacterium]|nr:choline/carnitine O-acyltransferase [Calditrichota bacterium]
MEKDQRTRDIYERHPNYPAPPLIPLPPLEEFYELSELRLKKNIFTRFVIRALFKFSGLERFYFDLKDNLEFYLRTTDMRSSSLYAPVVSATLAMKDDPEKLSPAERAVSFIMAAKQFYDDIHAGNLKPDKFKDQILEMGQYPNFFSTNVIVDKNGVRIFKSKKNNLIAVVVRNEIYIVEIDSWDDPQIAHKIKITLEKILREPRKNVPEIGLLSAASALTQRKAFRRLQKNSVNQKSLEMLKHVFLTVCFDLEENPRNYSQALLKTHSGNFANRWWHTSLQLVIFNNARACAIGNFSTYLDGNVMMGGIAEIRKRAALFRLPEQPPDFKQELNYNLLHWEVPDELIQRAKRDLDKIKDKQQQASFFIKNVNGKFFKSCGVPAVPAFIIALQMTVKQLLGHHADISQFIALSKYRYMDLTTTIVSTEEVKSFVDLILDDSKNDKKLFDLFKNAVESQRSKIRRARSCLGNFDIISLFFLNLKGWKRIRGQWSIAIGFRLLKKLGLLRINRREVLVSHPTLYPEIPLVGRPGIRLPYVKYFALHYQIWQEEITVTYMPGLKWEISNEKMTKVLQKNLERLQELIIENTH